MPLTPQRERDKRVAGLARLFENIAFRVPVALDVLQERTGYADGWPTRGDDPHVTTSSASSSVEQTACNVQAAREAIAQVYDDIDNLAVMAHDFNRMLERIIGTRPAERIEPKLCDPRGRDGCELPWTPGKALAAGNGWSDPACQNIASRGSLCDPCALREHRFRAHHDMPARKDGVFSQPARDEVA